MFKNENKNIFNEKDNIELYKKLIKKIIMLIIFFLKRNHQTQARQFI